MPEVVLVDVFTLSPLSGNPACVVLGAEDLDEGRKSRIAVELNQPETVFASATTDGIKLEFYTRGREVEICGHGVVAAGWLLARQSGSTKVSTKAQELEIWREGERVFVAYRKPTYSPVRGDREVVAKVLGLEPRDLAPGLPLEVVSVGLPQLMVPVASLDALRRVAPDTRKLSLLCAHAGFESLHVFTQETFDKECVGHARHFAPYYHVDEDPVTGTGNAGMVSYLVRHQKISVPEGKVRFYCEQGHFIGRPGMVVVEAQGKGGEVERLSIGGSCTEVLRGVLELEQKEARPGGLAAAAQPGPPSKKAAVSKSSRKK
jgi:PhzF family phenazine biosynthesis protein